MNIVFFGSGAFGLPTLEALVKSHRVLAVVTQPDRPAGRGGELTPTPVAEFAAVGLAGLRVLKPENVNVPEVAAQIQGFKADAAVIIAFGQKLSPAVLPGRGGDAKAINLHASLLPRWRGAAPINAAILAGDTVTGNSVITIAERMDAGLVLGQDSMAVDMRVTAGELHDQLSARGPVLVESVLAQMQAGTLNGRAQDESHVTKARKLSKSDAWIDFADSAEHGRRRVHGLTPWPGVAVQYRGQALKLLRVEARPNPHDEAPGTILDPALGLVACGAGSSLILLEVQPAGGKRMSWDEFARGRRPTQGEVLIGGGGGAKAC
jgi:methionyl-tRNA formyltransferase